MKGSYQEGLRHSKESLELIDDCIQKIGEDVRELNDWFMHYAQTQRERIAFDYDLINDRYNSDSIIVEVASIPLLLTLPLKLTGYNITGVDIEPERFQGTIDKFGLDVKKCNIEHDALPFPDNFCDVILFNEVFEHLRINLIFTLREILRVLKPGGRLFLSTRNLRSIVGVRNFLVRKISQSGGTDIYNEYSKLESIGHMGHVREYTSTEVSTFLGKIGFINETVIYRGTYRSKLDRLIIKLRPNLRPYFSCVAQKPC